MRIALKRFWHQQDGAVTVDWVVLTAAIVGLGLLVVSPIAVGTNSMSSDLKSYIETVAPGSNW